MNIEKHIKKSNIATAAALGAGIFAVAAGMSAGKLADKGLSEKGQAILWGTSLAGIGGMAAATVAMNYHDTKQRKAEEKLGVSEFERRILSLHAQRGGLNNG